VCEGQLDAIAIAAIAAQHRVPHMFAPLGLGTASISTCQVALASALHPKPMCIALDNDDRGVQGAVSVAAALIQAGREVISASLPEGEDPASWLATHPNGLQAFDRNVCLSSTGVGNPPSPVGQLVTRAALNHYMMVAATAAPPDAELRSAKENARDLILQFGANQPTAAARRRYIDSAACEIVASQLGSQQAATNWLQANLDARRQQPPGRCPLDERVPPRPAPERVVNMS
jgi:hypothetical protein